MTTGRINQVTTRQAPAGCRQTTENQPRKEGGARRRKQTAEVKQGAQAAGRANSAAASTEN